MALNNLQGLICHKTQQTKLNLELDPMVLCYAGLSIILCLPEGGLGRSRWLLGLESITDLELDPEVVWEVAYLYNALVITWRLWARFLSGAVASCSIIFIIVQNGHSDLHSNEAGCISHCANTLTVTLSPIRKL